MKKLDNIITGILLGLLLPIGFIWLYCNNFFPDEPVIELLKSVWGTTTFGRLMILAIIPNLGAIFLLYKHDIFKLGTGVVIGMIPYLIMSVLSLVVF